MENKPEHLKRPCPKACPFTGSPDCAMCSDNERFVRYYMHGPIMEPMSKEEREWCIEEADRSGEGSYPREETESLDDRNLAKTTFLAWSDYVQSNCM